RRNVRFGLPASFLPSFRTIFREVSDRYAPVTPAPRQSLRPSLWLGKDRSSILHPRQLLRLIVSLKHEPAPCLFHSTGYPFVLGLFAQDSNLSTRGESNRSSSSK